MKFEIIKGTKNLNGTCYFEFVKNKDKTKPCWNENALYLQDEVFNYFINVFSKSSDRFDYFSFCTFNQYELKSLKENLADFKKKLNAVKNLDDSKSLFENDYVNIFLSNDLENNWQSASKELVKITENLENLVAECIREKETFWILGL